MQNTLKQKIKIKENCNFHTAIHQFVIIFSKFQFLNFFVELLSWPLDINLNMWFVCEGQFFPVVFVYLLPFFKFSSIIEKPALKKFEISRFPTIFKEGYPKLPKAKNQEQ